VGLAQELINAIMGIANLAAQLVVQEKLAVGMVVLL
jgi:hypothetical protein